MAKEGTTGCGAYVGGKPALEHYKDGLFGKKPRVTRWKRGEPAEVYWSSGVGHRGGYAYRLCKVYKGQYWKVTEECFQKGHLNFYGKRLMQIFHIFHPKMKVKQLGCMTGHWMEITARMDGKRLT